MRLITALSVALAVVVPARAQSSELDALLGRAAAYVQQFVGGFSNVVAEEDYRQEWQNGARRRLTSDFLLVRYPGSEREWLSFRDVYEVDGRPVRDQQERLTKLFLEPFDDALRRAQEITLAGSRHSLVELGPLSNPLLVLAFLQAYYRPQFTFTLGRLEPRLGPRVRALELDERFLPTPESPVRRAPPLAATAWLDEDTGRVVKTRVRTGVAPNTRIAEVTFRFDDGLDIDVPAEMRESRLGPPTIVTPGRIPTASSTFTGVATYRRFRRFQVRTEEKIESDR